MNRRDALKALLASLGGTAGFGLGTGLLIPAFVNGAPLALTDDTQPVYGGWVDRFWARVAFIRDNQYPFLSQQNREIRGTGKGRCVLLWKPFEFVTGGELVPHYQEIGDCVGHAYGLGVDVLTATQIVLKNRNERWVTKSSTEIIYAGSRVQVGEGKVGFEDGSIGVWAAEFCRRWGVLLRQAYLDGAYDFTRYCGQTARSMGRPRAGVPVELEPLCKEHPVKTSALVRTWAECRDAVANGYPVTMCSNIGFNTVRDSEGFLHRGRRPWYHAMTIIGVDDAYRRPGALVQNSWGPNWVTGPTRHGQPKGSFWCDASVIDAAMQQGDSVALSGYVGYPRQDIPDYILF